MPWPPALVNLGDVALRRNQHEEAVEQYNRAAGYFRLAGWAEGQGLVLGKLGDALHALGRLDEAMTNLDRDAGRLDIAAKRARTALKLVRQAGDERVEADTLNTLGTIHHRLGRTAQAIDFHQEALDLARRAGIRYHTAETLIGLAEAREDPGDARQALALTRAAGYRGLERHALKALAQFTDS